MVVEGGIFGRPRHADGRDLLRGAASGITRRAPLNVAALTAAILFCLQPLQIVDAGFALTFGATLGILIGMSRMRRLLAAAAVGASRRLRSSPLRCAPRSRCCPLARFVFSRVTFAGLLVNFAAIPLMTVVQIAGMVVGGARVVGAGARPSGPAGSRTWRLRG